jgi:hypothetical protein
MNVGELKKMLEKYPDDMEIIINRCSDYGIVEENCCEIRKGVPTNYGVMRSHSTMSEENKHNEKNYLYLSDI